MAAEGAVRPDGQDERSGRTTRWVAAAAVIAAIVLVALIVFGGGGYEVTAEFTNAGQLVKGNQVKVAGAPVGSVKKIRVSDDGRALVTFSVNDKYSPLRQGTRAVVKQASLSGIANRYIDLQLGPYTGAAIDDGGRISADHTASAVDLDQVFDMLDPGTRAAAQDFVQGNAQLLHGRAKELNRSVKYLNPALSTGTRLFSEFTRDEPLLDRFLVDSARLVHALASRRNDLSALTANLDTTFTALGDEKAALGESIDRLPPFMRRANTTFVNLRAALDDLDPLVNASKPVARKLGPFLDQAQAFAADAKPTVRDLSRTVRRAGPSNDLIELVQSFPLVTSTALDSHRIHGATRAGAFPESTEALRRSAPTIALGRPYTPDLVGWFDDFSTTGAYDALGNFSRAFINLSEVVSGHAGPKTGQFKRCPGASETAAPDGSNVFSADEQAQLDCRESDRAVGP